MCRWAVPGRGADIDEEVRREHPWPGTSSRPAMFYGMDPDQMGRR